MSGETYNHLEMNMKTSPSCKFLVKMLSAEEYSQVRVKAQTRYNKVIDKFR